MPQIYKKLLKKKEKNKKTKEEQYFQDVFLHHIRHPHTPGNLQSYGGQASCLRENMKKMRKED